MNKNQIDIVKAITAGKYHSSFILCYSFDLAFYESIILSSLRSIGCRNNALIVDDEKYQESLDLLGGLVAHPGHLYSITPITARGSFHPKLIFLLGDHEVALLIGTGNASLGGYSRNRELFFHVKANNQEDKTLRLILNAWHFIKMTVGERPSFITLQIRMAEHETPLLLEAKKGGAIQEVIIDFPDGSKAGLLTTDSKDSLLSKFYGLAGRFKAESLSVMSPFFDSGVKTIKSLIKAFDPKVVNVIIQPNSVNIDVKALTDKRIKLFRFQSPFQQSTPDRELYLHAKGIFLQTKEGEHSLLGSANITYSALGDMKAPGLNIEACLYVFSPEKNRLINILGLDDSIKGRTLVSKEDLSLIKWQTRDRTINSSSRLSLLGIEYASDRLIAYCADSLKPDLSWNIELLDKINTQVGLCKAHSISNNSITFYCDSKLIEKAIKGRVVMDGNKKTKTYIIHRIAPLNHNSPNIQTRKAWEAIESIQLGSDDLSELIEPFEQLLFCNPQPEGKQSSGHSPGMRKKEDNISEASGDEKKVSYEEFVSHVSKEKLEKRYSLISEMSPLGLIIEFLLSRIGYREKNNITIEDQELAKNTYDEEDFMQSSEGTEQIQEREITYVKKQTTISNSQFDRQQKRLYKLADKYCEYLDDLFSENNNSKLDPTETVKYFAAILLLIHFADKEISFTQKDRKEYLVMFPLYDEEEEYDFTYYGFEITSKFFSVAPISLIQRIIIPQQYGVMPDDISSSIAIGAYVLNVLLLIGARHNYNAITDIEISALRLYINAGITKNVIEQNTLLKLFEGFHGQAGFKNKVTLEKVIEQHNEILHRAKEYDRKISPAKKTFSEEKGNLEKVNPGDMVWNPKSGLGIVKRIEDTTRIIVTNPGFRNEDDEEKNNERAISQGYLVKIR